MLGLVLINSAIIAVVYLILGLHARRLRKRLDAAQVRLADTTVEEGIQANFIKMRKTSANRALTIFWFGLVAFVIALGVGFQIYATAIEPRADIGNWLIVSAVVYGIGLLGAAIILGMLVSVFWQSRQAVAFIDAYVNDYPNSPVLREVRDMIAPRIGELGVSVVAALVVAGCVLYGLVLIAIFYMAAQTAIDCARSSKCI